MAFGRSKKRESWSTRPLSMILPDNVKLFQRKGKSVMEKAMQDQNRKGIAEGVSEPRQQPPRPEQSQTASAIRTAAATSPTRTENTVVEMSEQEVSPGPQPVQQLRTEKTSAKDAREMAPFLTLNLGDTPDSLLDISDQYSHAENQSVASDQHVSGILNSKVSKESIAGDELSDISRDGLSSLDDSRGLEPNETEDTVESIQKDTSLAESPTARSPSLKTPTDEVAALDISQMPWALPGNESPVPVRGPTTTLQKSLHMPAVSMPTMSIPTSPNLGPSARQDSTSSTDSQSSAHTLQDEFVLDHNRKIIVNHGVYIFDPANDHDMARLHLSADESFNPFEYD